nr:transposase [Clostridium sp. WB02_MRS01]
MFYLGIDIGKNTHVASLMYEKSKLIFKAHSFSNTPDDAAILLEKISPYAAQLEIGSRNSSSLHNIKNH